jgi:chemotaxis protein histidine kinase CheA
MLNFAKDLAAALDALRRHVILFLLGVTIVALALLGRSWLDAHDASLRLQATLAAQQKTITDADQRQSTRDAQLTQTLAQISAAKQKVQTPTQAAAALTQAIPQLIAGGPAGQTLPSPITIELPTGSPNGNIRAEGSRSAGILPAGSSADPQNANSQLEVGVTNSSAGATVPDGAPNEAKSATPSATISSAAKYPWTALKSELAKLGLGHVAQPGEVQPGGSAAAQKSPSQTDAAEKHSGNKDTENRQGSVTSQKGNPASRNAQTTSASQPGASAPGNSSTNSSTQSGSSAQTSSPPQSAASAQSTSSSTLSNSATQTNSTTNTNSATTGATADLQSGPPPAIIRVPQEDLKPLYDAVEDCQTCQAKLAAAQGDLSDEKTKFAAATAQRDAAITAARGTFWKRAGTAAKWLAIGAAAGAVLARYH